MTVWKHKLVANDPLHNLHIGNSCERKQLHLSRTFKIAASTIPNTCFRYNYRSPILQISFLCNHRPYCSCHFSVDSPKYSPGRWRSSVSTLLFFPRRNPPDHFQSTGSTNFVRHLCILDLFMPVAVLLSAPHGNWLKQLQHPVFHLSFSVLFLLPKLSPTK